jgi:hypothetical protein
VVAATPGVTLKSEVKMMDLPNSLRGVHAGTRSFADLVEEFQGATFRRPQAGRPGTVAEVYARAEEDDPDDVPEQLARASFAGYITPAQERQLLGIYSKAVAG